MPNLLVVYSISGTDTNKHYQTEIAFDYVDVKKGGTRSFQLLSEVADVHNGNTITWDQVVIRTSIDLSVE